MGNKNQTILQGNLAGLCNFEGYVGEKDIKITFFTITDGDNDPETIAVMTGKLAAPLDCRNSVVGSGKWTA